MPDEKGSHLERAVSLNTRCQCGETLRCGNRTVKVWDSARLWSAEAPWAEAVRRAALRAAAPAPLRRVPPAVKAHGREEASPAIASNRCWSTRLRVDEAVQMPRAADTYLVDASVQKQAVASKRR